MLWISYQVAIGSAHKTIFLALNALKAHVYFIETCQYHLSYVITVGCYYASAATAVFIAISGSLINGCLLVLGIFINYRFFSWHYSQFTEKSNFLMELPFHKFWYILWKTFYFHKYLYFLLWMSFTFSTPTPKERHISKKARCKNLPL